ncbi:hypothetical protein [Sphingopyxis terrae]|uniref:hypothetical protein n=1 Tax=Sphingopyxis terrae TaxID=33052 RepID=UPI003F7DD2A6
MQKMFRAATLSLVTAATVSACAATRDVAALPDAANVAIGQRAYADGPLIQPVAVIEDSRCPVGVACVWAGRVRVKMLWLRPNGEAQPLEAVLGEPTPIADGTITLESVHPEKRVDQAIRPGDYRFAFRFMGGL